MNLEFKSEEENSIPDEVLGIYRFRYGDEDECRDYFDGDSTSEVIAEVRDFLRDTLRDEVNQD